MELLIDHVSKCFKDKKAVNNISLALLLFILPAYLPTTYCYSNYTDEAGNKANLTGLASITCEKERQADNVGIVTPERVRKAVEMYQEVEKPFEVYPGITDFQFLSLGWLAVWTPYAIIGACVIEIPLFAFLSMHSYCGHAVN